MRIFLDVRCICLRSIYIIYIYCGSNPTKCGNQGQKWYANNKTMAPTDTKLLP